jgi:Zn-dependent peptidase ImmA (M78 family)/transcriptional regulator with XRE-family HTH domain
MNGTRLRYAREIKGWTQEVFAEKLGIRQSMVAYLEGGARMPSSELQQRIVDTTGFPLAFFMEEFEHEFPLGSLLYRKHSELPAQERIWSHRIAELSFNLMQHMAGQLKPLVLRIPKDIDEDAVTAAQLVRSAIGCDSDSPLKNLMNKLERAGVSILMLPDEIERLDSFSTWVDGVKPVIVLSPEKPGDRQRMSLAHELGHLVLHRSIRGNLEGVEKEAFQFAAELLMPEDAMRREMTPPVTLSALAELKLRWGVAMQALLYRARELEIITPHIYKHLIIQQTKNWGRKVEPQATYIKPHKPRVIRQMAELLYGDDTRDTINYRKLSDETHLPLFWAKRIIDAHAGKNEPLGASSSASSPVLRFPEREARKDA